MKITHDDVDTLARTIYGEARGENMLGKRAVAHVILNRVKANSWWGKTIAGVCRYKWQFSCWNRWRRFWLFPASDLTRHPARPITIPSPFRRNGPKAKSLAELLAFTSFTRG
jgi:hypothetical protein